MTYRVLILRAAERDLHDLRTYVIARFGQDVWRESYAQIKAAITNLTRFPLSGVVPAALEDLQLGQYRQIISGNNRIIYEVRENTLYIHMIVDCRREMKTILSHRILRATD